MTGLYPWHHRVFDNAVQLPTELQTLAASLREVGVQTSAVVSSFVLERQFGFDRGFDRYEFQPDRGYTFRGKRKRGFWTRGGAITDHAIALLEAQAQLDGTNGTRFFIWLHYFDPHDPYLPPDEWALPESHIVDTSGKSLSGKTSTRPALERLNRAYRGEVRYVDHQIGRLLEALARLGLAETTAVIATADHGEGLGDHGRIQHGTNVYDELVRVPLIVKAPGIVPGQRLAGSAQLEDLFPTVLDLFAEPIPAGLDGVNLLPWLRGEMPQSPRYAAVGRRKAYSTKPDLYFYRRFPAKWQGELSGPGENYALDVDPRETAPMAGSGPPQWLRDQIGAAADAEASTPLADPSALDPEVREALEALGYLPPTKESGQP